MNIVKRELRANLKSFIIWIVSIGTVLMLASTEFSVFNNDPKIMEIMEQFDFMFAIIGVSMANIAQPEGYLSLISIYIFLPLAIYAALLGSSIISKEERDKTAEYLFTLPVSRTRVLTGKMIAAVIYVLLSALSLYLISILMFYRFDPSPVFYEFAIYLSIGLLILELVFMSIGMMFSAVLRQYKRSGSVTLGFLMGSFLFSMLMGMTDKLDFLKFITPFQYFPVGDLLNSEINLFYLIFSSGIVIACIGSVFVFFKKRDLYI